MNELEDYYKEKYKDFVGLDFKQLTPEFRRSIENTMGFAAWRFQKAANKLLRNILVAVGLLKA